MTPFTLTWIDTLDTGFAQIAHQFLEATQGSLSSLFRFITILGNGGMIFIILGLFLLLFKRPRKVAMIALISMLIGFLLTNILLKNVIARPRPFLDTTSDYFVWWQQAGSLAQDGYAFPSGHATVATAFAFPFFLILNKKYAWSFLLIPLVMGFTRIYFMVHFTSDVIGGFIIGILTSIAAYYWTNALMKIEIIKRWIDLPSILSLLPRRKEKNKD